MGQISIGTPIDDSLIQCCSCHKGYEIKGNIYENNILVCPHCGLQHKLDFTLIDKRIEILNKVDRLNLTEIDIGSDCIGRDSYLYGNYTSIDLTNPANATGVITSVDIWAAVSMTGAYAAIFYRPDPTGYPAKFTARSASSNLGAIAAGSAKRFAVNLPVTMGDHIGLYFTAEAAQLECDTSGGSGVYYLAGDQTACVNTTFTLAANYCMSVYGISAIALNSVATIVCFIGGEINIGSPAINSNDNYTFSTRVDANNPANATGKITKVEIWANTQIAGCKVATFSASGNNLTTRDYETVDNGNGAGVVLVGSKQTFVVDIDVEEGDYIGLWGSAGKIDVDSLTPATGTWYNVYDQIPCDNVGFTLVANKTISLYGTGGGVSLGRGITEALTSTTNIAVSITSLLSRGIKEVLNSTSAITTSIISVLSRGIKATLTSTSAITTSIISSLSRGIKEALTSTVNIATSITSVLSSGILRALNSTVNIVSSITANLKAIYHWVKVIKEKADSTKVEKGKDDWILVSKEKGDTTKVSKSKDDWTKVIKEKGDISKVEKE